MVRPSWLAMTRPRRRARVCRNSSTTCRSCDRCPDAALRAPGLRAQVPYRGLMVHPPTDRACAADLSLRVRSPDPAPAAVRRSSMTRETPFLRNKVCPRSPPSQPTSFDRPINQMNDARPVRDVNRQSEPHPDLPTVSRENMVTDGVRAYPKTRVASDLLVIAQQTVTRFASSFVTPTSRGTM